MYMTEETKVDIVLYYTRTAIAEPSEPKFDDVKKSYPDIDTDSLLDIFSNKLKNYKKNLAIFENYKDNNVLSEFVLIAEDENFIENVQNFQKNEFFIDWTKNSKNLISETIKKIYG
jgi:hypothetical protein